MSIPNIPISATLYGWLTLHTERDGTDRYTYLGYPLCLSKDESRLLRALLTQDPTHADAQGYFPVLGLQASMQVLAKDLLSPSPYSPERIAILAGRINRKAAAIGGRKLILGKSHHGYRVNPYM